MAGATRGFNTGRCAAKFDIVVIRCGLNVLHNVADRNVQREIVRFISGHGNNAQHFMVVCVRDAT